MKKFIFKVALIFFMFSTLLFTSETHTVKLRYGENILTINIVNNTNAILTKLKVHTEKNKLPKGISLSQVKSNNHNIKVKILVENNVHNGFYNVPLLLSDSLNNKWTYFLNLQVTKEIPAKFNLNQNYPNPFNGTTIINYSLSEDISENVKLIVYNSLGQKVKTLLNEKLTSGTYKAVWNGKDELGNSCSSGIYFYSLKAGNFSDVKKMIFLE